MIFQVVLEQAWDQGMKPILVLNKVDRLITEMKLDSRAAYHHINQVLEQVDNQPSTGAARQSTRDWSR